MIEQSSSNSILQLQTATDGNCRTASKAVPFDRAFEIAMALSQPVRSETVPLSSARNRVLATNAVAQVNMPPWPRAMMDGYALRAQDVHGPDTQIKAVEQLAAGDNRNLQISAGEAIRIATGAPLPEGADSVARFEWCREMVGNYIRLIHPIQKGESVQPIGDDAKKGQVLLHRGMALNGARIAVCRGFGIDEVCVTIPPSISIIVTGSELVPDVHQTLKPGQIYASTDSYLTDALERDGILDVSVQYVRDDVRVLTNTIAQASKQSDYVLLTGGVSAGDFDYVPYILRKLGGELNVERVLMRPGAPLVGTRVNHSTIFAMSGNPAACLIQFEMFVRPAIRKSLGIEGEQFPASGKLLKAIELKPIKLVRVLRAHATISNGEVWVDAGMAQSPGVVSGFATANCLIRVDQHVLGQGAVLPLCWL